VEWQSSSLLLPAAFLAAILLLALIVLIRRRTDGKGSTILLMGASDGGKTAILTSLLLGEVPPTHTSMRANASSVAFDDPKKPLRIIDVPGHPRLRGQFEEYLGDTRAIVFVVDASTIARNAFAVADHLHVVLNAITSIPKSQTQPSLLILAHKTDLVTATSASTTSQIAITRVRTVLERELDKRAQAQKKTVGIERMGDEGKEIELGGLDCINTNGFRFSDWEAGQIDFAGSFVRVTRNDFEEEAHLGMDEKAQQEDTLQELRDWVNQIVR